MTRGTLVLALVLLASAPTTGQAASGQDADELVIEAILSHTIRPAIARVHGQRLASTGKSGSEKAPLAIVVNSTIPVCDEEQLRPLGCVRREWLDGQYGGVIDPETTRQLVAVFLMVNAVSDTISPIDSEDIILSTYEQVETVCQAESMRTTGYVGFSRPAVLENRYALAYAIYGYGDVGAKGWIFVLERRSEAWQVIYDWCIWMS